MSTDATNEPQVAPCGYCAGPLPEGGGVLVDTGDSTGLACSEPCEDALQSLGAGTAPLAVHTAWERDRAFARQEEVAAAAATAAPRAPTPLDTQLAWLQANALSVSIEVNAHRTLYETIDAALEGEDCDADQKSECSKTGQLVVVQCYPRTPVGFYRIVDHEIASAVDRMFTVVRAELGGELPPGVGMSATGEPS